MAGTSLGDKFQSVCVWAEDGELALPLLSLHIAGR